MNQSQHGCTNGCSEDLRGKIVAAVECEICKSQSLRVLSVSLYSDKRYLKKATKLLEADLRQRPFALPSKSTAITYITPRAFGQPLDGRLRQRSDPIEQRKNGTINNRAQRVSKNRLAVMGDAVVEQPEKLLFVDKRGLHTWIPSDRPTTVIRAVRPHG